MLLSLINSITSASVFKENNSISYSYIGYVFLVVIGLLGIYVLVLLFLKKYNLIPSFSSKSNNNKLHIIQRCRLTQSVIFIHFNYLGEEFKILDNGTSLLNLEKKYDKEIENE